VNSRILNAAPLECSDETRALLKAATEMGLDTPYLVWKDFARATLVRIQSEQNSDLFRSEKTQIEGVERSLRSSQNIKDRILTYVLLFDRSADSGLDANLPADTVNWNSYDLFYYLMSLIPAEIQVRTSLADTMAEQYHSIYKSNPDRARSDSVQIDRLGRIGRELDELACQTDDVYEGVVLHHDD
jgi:hypothetical protein